MVTLLFFLVGVAQAAVLPDSCFSNAHTPCSISSSSTLSHIPDHHVSRANRGKTCCDSPNRLTSAWQCHCERTGLIDFSKSSAIIPSANQWDNQPVKHFKILIPVWINIPVLHSFPPPELFQQPISFALTVLHATVLLI
jgi:hypothetical protein